MEALINGILFGVFFFTIQYSCKLFGSSDNTLALFFTVYNTMVFCFYYAQYGILYYTTLFFSLLCTVQWYSCLYSVQYNGILIFTLYNTMTFFSLLCTHGCSVVTFYGSFGNTMGSLFSLCNFGCSEIFLSD